MCRPIPSYVRVSQCNCTHEALLLACTYICVAPVACSRARAAAVWLVVSAAVRSRPDRVRWSRPDAGWSKVTVVVAACNRPAPVAHIRARQWPAACRRCPRPARVGRCPGPARRVVWHRTGRRLALAARAGASAGGCLPVADLLCCMRAHGKAHFYTSITVFI
jgi:hypothetical protein